MNNTYKIKVKSPLLRPGLEIETEVSEAYLVSVLRQVMKEVRAFNNTSGAPGAEYNDE